MDREYRQQKERYADLLEMSRRQHMYKYTDFLAQADAADACRAAPEAERAVFGGAENCERVMVRFGNPADLGYEEPFPIAVLKICPGSLKYAEALNHRDYLGALMHLGVERDVLGDILVRETGAYVFAEEHMADFLSRELTRVRHTPVVCEVLHHVPEDARPRLQEEEMIVSSLRLDNIAAKAFHLSRTRAKDLFAAGQVQVSGRLCEKESFVPAEGDIISIRGHGKFRCGSQTGETKKGNMVLSIFRYI